METHRRALVLFGPGVLILIVWGWELVRDLGRALGWWR
jgi:hypothetical protein